MSKLALTLPALRWNGVSVPPGAAARSAANALRRNCKHGWTATSIQQLQAIPTDTPELAFLGRSNVGKSSLLNALMGTSKMKLVRTSARPGYTRYLQGYSVMGGKLTLVDTPGYGFKSQEEWGELIMHFIRERPCVRRTFVLIEASHGIKSSDEALIRHLANAGAPFQIVMTKADKRGKSLGALERFEKDMVDLKSQLSRLRGASLWSEILAVSERITGSTDQLAASLLAAAGLEITASSAAKISSKSCVA
ncbi:hypothetical protein PYCC9005_001785 [Savitreella phatthalungensis]